MIKKQLSDRIAALKNSIVGLPNHEIWVATVIICVGWW